MYQFRILLSAEIHYFLILFYFIFRKMIAAFMLPVSL